MELPIFCVSTLPCAWQLGPLFCQLSAQCPLPVSICPCVWSRAFCPFLCAQHPAFFFPIFRLPGASSLCPLLSAHMPGSLPFWHSPVCPLLPLLFARVACGPPLPGSWPPPASERNGKEARRKRKLCRASLPILRGRWAGILACSCNRSSRRPVFPSPGCSSELVRSLPLTLIRSISRLRAYFGAGFLQNEVCRRRRRRRREKKVGSS
jgi:hypothetical protein